MIAAQAVKALQAQAMDDGPQFSVGNAELDFIMLALFRYIMKMGEGRLARQQAPL